MALPQFGLDTAVRVCADCFNNASGFKAQSPGISSNGINAVTTQVSKLDISTDSDSITTQSSDNLPNSGAPECKCGMPLCICESPAAKKESAVIQVNTPTTIPVPSTSIPKKADSAPKSKASTSSSKPGSVFNQGQASSGNADLPHKDYEVSGEGLREAIKNGDAAGAKKLLNQGVDANYCDKQGSSLLHLAAVFNQTEIAFALMEKGARADSKNSQGETPLDCAPATLQYKMKSKIEESRKSDP